MQIRFVRATGIFRTKAAQILGIHKYDLWKAPQGNEAGLEA
jgi:hypothetical protein